jgi:hypothetical protein
MKLVLLCLKVDLLTWQHKVLTIHDCSTKVMFLSLSGCKAYLVKISLANKEQLIFVQEIFQAWAEIEIWNGDH